MNARISRFFLLVLLGGLAACGSVSAYGPAEISASHFDASTDPYWQDPKWDKALFDAAQASVHNPSDPTDTSTSGLHAVVKFTYLSGSIEYPEIIQSTGDLKKDELMLHQLASAQLPQAAGIDEDKPHEFVLDLDMLTPFEALEYSVVAAIDYARVYPKEAVIGGYQGLATVGFDYIDGKATNIAVTKSSGNRYLDQASIGAVSKASLPAPPAVYAGKTLRMEQTFCYSLNGRGNCPARRDMVQVYGTLIRR